MLTPIKIVLISSVFIPNPSYDHSFILDNDYTMEASMYMIKKYPQNQDINSILFLKILTESE